MSAEYGTIADATKPPRWDGPPYAMGVGGSVPCREPTQYPESYKDHAVSGV